jgi:hypothetical protein
LQFKLGELAMEEVVVFEIYKYKEGDATWQYVY